MVVIAGRLEDKKMDGEDYSTHAGPGGIGRTLELARKDRGLSLKQVEQATKIRTRYLRELERENFDVLPAVYMQGSLKTYANFLHLDGEALAREFRRRRGLLHGPQGSASVELPKGDYFDRSLIFLGGAAGAGRQEMTKDEEDLGAAPILAGGNVMYLGLAAFLALVLVAAVALALTLPRGSRPPVSQVREPLISQTPPQASRIGGESKRVEPQRKYGERSADNEAYSRQPAAASNQDDRVPARAGRNQGGSYLAQGPRYATATPSASPAAQKEPATPEPDAASTPPPAEQRYATGVRVPGPAHQRGGAPPPHPRTTRNALPVSPSGDFNVRVVVAAEHQLRITGNPVNHW